MYEQTIFQLYRTLQMEYIRKQVKKLGRMELKSVWFYPKGMRIVLESDLTNSKFIGTRLEKLMKSLNCLHVQQNLNFTQFPTAIDFFIQYDLEAEN